MPASVFLMYTGRNWPNPVCSFYLPVSMSRNDSVHNVSPLLPRALQLSACSQTAPTTSYLLLIASSGALGKCLVLPCKARVQRTFELKATLYTYSLSLSLSLSKRATRVATRVWVRVHHMHDCPAASEYLRMAFFVYTGHVRRSAAT